MGGFGARVGDAFVLIVFVALAAVLVRPGSQTSSVFAAGGNAFSGSIKAATLR
jgi:hypothetical protein